MSFRPSQLLLAAPINNHLPSFFCSHTGNIKAQNIKAGNGACFAPSILCTLDTGATQFTTYLPFSTGQLLIPGKRCFLPAFAWIPWCTSPFL